MKDPKDTQTIDAFEKKPMTAAERKAKQRANMQGRIRLDCYISAKHKAMLDEYRLAHMTIAETIEMLIAEKFPEDYEPERINSKLPY